MEIESQTQPPATPRLKRSLPYLIVLVALLGVAWIIVSRVPGTGAGTDGVADPRESPRAGFISPRIQSVTLDGEEFDSQTLRGRVVVINFWATWCAPCRAEMPALQALFQRRRPDGLMVIGVNQAEDPTLISPFVAEFGLTFPIVLDPVGAWSRRYGIRGLPTTFFVNRQGIIRDMLVGGPMDSALLESKVDALLRE